MFFFIKYHFSICIQRKCRLETFEVKQLNYIIQIDNVKESNIIIKPAKSQSVNFGIVLIPRVILSLKLFKLIIHFLFQFKLPINLYSMLILEKASHRTRMDMKQGQSAYQMKSFQDSNSFLRIQTVTKSWSIGYYLENQNGMQCHICGVQKISFFMVFTLLLI